MNNIEKCDLINKLMNEISDRWKEYEESSERDDILEIKKSIRIKIKELEKQIELLRVSDDSAQ